MALIFFDIVARTALKSLCLISLNNLFILIFTNSRLLLVILFHFSTLKIIFLPVNYEIFYGIMGWLSALLFVLLYDT